LTSEVTEVGGGQDLAYYTISFSNCLLWWCFSLEVEPTACPRQDYRLPASAYQHSLDNIGNILKLLV